MQFEMCSHSTEYKMWLFERAGFYYQRGKKKREVKEKRKAYKRKEKEEREKECFLD